MDDLDQEQVLLLSCGGSQRYAMHADKQLR